MELSAYLPFKTKTQKKLAAKNLSSMDENVLDELCTQHSVHNIINDICTFCIYSFHYKFIFSWLNSDKLYFLVFCL